LHVPLLPDTHHLIDPANRMKRSRDFAGRTRTFYSFTWEGHHIWGATASMLVGLAERLYDVAP